MNTMRSESTGFSPFLLVYGREPDNILYRVIGYDGIEFQEDPGEYLKIIQDWLQNARAIARIKNERAYEREAPRFNAKRRHVEFKQGDLVAYWRP